MFRTRASFPKSILYLFAILALAFSEKSNEVSSKKLEEFGCEFDSNDYSTLSMTTIRINSNLAAWRDVKMKSNAVDDFEKFGEPFKKLFSEASILNDLSLFTEFVTEYKKNSSHTPFKTFLNNYAVPIEPKQYCGPNNKIRKIRDPASYLIQELHYLKEIKEKSVSPYLVSAYIDPFKVNSYSDESDAEDVSENNKLRQNRVQDHLAGIIKIHRGNRTGYILIDPGYANGKNLYQPVVMYVMNDRQPPHGEILRGPERTNQRGSVKVIAVGDANNPFILVEHSLWQKIVRVLYYVGMPYCSFMENTIKLNMMRPYHGIIESNNQGNPHAYLWYKISKDTEGLQKNLFFQRTVQVPSTVENNRIGGLVPDTEVSSINKQLEIVEDDVLKNKTVFDEIIGLTQTLGLDREPRKRLFQKIFG